MSAARGANGPVAEANRHCARLTREQAANFYYGMALLPRRKRQAMFAVYAFARRVDDIGDGDLDSASKLALLERERERLLGLGSPEVAEGSDRVMVALAQADRDFGLPREALGDLIDGVRMDVEGVRYRTFEDLEGYCRRVAGSIGRLSLAIFGFEGPPDAWRIADDLGVALQLTNILRDLREDAARGRVYLPEEELVRFHLRDGGAIGPEEMAALARAAGGGHSGWGEPAKEALGRQAEGVGVSGQELEAMAALIRWQAARAREWFAVGMGLVAMLDRRSGACVAAMSGIYRQLLEEIERDPRRALAVRTSLTGRRKATVALRGLVLGGRKR